MSEGHGAGAFVTISPGQRLAVLDDFVVVHLSSVVGAAMARALFEHGRARDEKGPQLALLYFVERGGIGVPDAASRDAWTELSRTSGAYYAASALVVPGDGLAPAIAHAFVQGVRAISGGKLPLAIFSSVPSAIGWLRQAAPGTRLPTDEVIETMVDRLRAIQ